MQIKELKDKIKEINKEHLGDIKRVMVFDVDKWVDMDVRPVDIGNGEVVIGIVAVEE